jgi:hypothetical protein
VFLERGRGLQNYNCKKQDLFYLAPEKYDICKSIVVVSGVGTGKVSSCTSSLSHPAKLPQCGIFFIDFGDFMYIYLNNRLWIFFRSILILHLTYF